MRDDRPFVPRHLLQALIEDDLGLVQPAEFAQRRARTGIPGRRRRKPQPNFLPSEKRCIETPGLFGIPGRLHTFRECRRLDIHIDFQNRSL